MKMAHHSTLTLFLAHLSEHGHAEQNLVSPPHLPEVGWKQGVLGKFLFVVFRRIKLHHGPEPVSSRKCGG